MKNTIRVLCVALALLLLSGCGAIAPKEKTILLSEAVEAPKEESHDPSARSFAVKKIVQLPMDKLDPTGDHPDVNRAVAGWIDNDNLVAMSVQTVQVGDPSETPAQEGGVAQPTQRVITQFTRINYQYGFFDPILTLADVEAECFDVSFDGTLAAYVAGNVMDIYSFQSGTRVQTVTRQVLASRVTFAQDSRMVYFTAAGEDKLLESLHADTGVNKGYLADRSYRVLAANDKAMLVCTQTDGSETLSYYDGTNFTQNALDAKARATSAHILPGGQALVSYAGDLYLVDGSGAQLVEEDVVAFDIASDGMHVAFARRNPDGTTDIRIGYWGGRGILNDRLTYKDIGVSVNAMCFSPDLYKLYLQGMSESGALVGYTFELE